MKAGETITLVRRDGEEGKVTAKAVAIHDNAVQLDGLGTFFLEDSENAPEDLVVWAVERSLAERMAEIMDGMDHLREGADGFRKRLLGDGWSETIAEQIAAGMLMQMIGAAFRQGES